MKKLLLATVAAGLIGLSLAPAQAEYMTEHRGGTMRLVARSAAGTVDPHINYTLQYWQIYQSLYDGLLAFKRPPARTALPRCPIWPKTCQWYPTMAKPIRSSCAKV